MFNWIFGDDDTSKVKAPDVKSRKRLSLAAGASGKGKIGLTNLGNTCFMNAGLQCLSHIEPLTDYFLSEQYAEEINHTNPLGNGGKLAEAFAEMQHAVWQADAGTHWNPKSLHRKLAGFAPHLFEGYEQQDVQEFLAFCLDGLHEDLNRVSKRPPPLSDDEEAADEKLANEKGEEFAAALSWMRHLQRGKSFLVDLLQGQLRSSLVCAECGYTSRRFEPFLYLSLPVTDRMQNVTDALEKYLEQEVLTGDEQWFCVKCNKKVNANKKIDIWKLPAVLVVHLKRFEFDMRTFRFRKIKVALTAPSRINLDGYCSSEQRSGVDYSVTCVANHIGPYGSGHYTATCRVGDAERGPWHYFDDQRVRPLRKDEDPLGGGAYVIFLVRCDEAVSSEAVGSQQAHSGKHAPTRQTLANPQNWPHLASSRNSVLAALLSPSEISSPSVISEGWLGKRGPTTEWKWPRRWCVLRPGSLGYYDDEELEQKRGEIHLTPTTRVSAVKNKDAPGEAAKYVAQHPFGFVLDLDPRAGKNRHLFYFDAESGEALQRWTKGIIAAIR